MKGFTLVELLVIISIIAILAAVIILVINPLELIHRSRDATRIKDLDNLAQAINVSTQEAGMSSNSIVSILCKTSGSYPCVGSTFPSTGNSRLTNGNGWVKANLAIQSSVTFTSLPVDPVNNANYHYTYCADGDKWEINAALESDQIGSKAYSDGGNTVDHYEVGSSYTLIANSGGSCEY